jgi:hypothetical protein
MVLYSIVSIFYYAHIQSMQSCALPTLSHHLEALSLQRVKRERPKNPNSLFLMPTEINIG